MKRFRPRLLKRFRRDADGAAAVEFAMIGTVLTFFVMGVVELGLMMAAQGMLDNVVFSAARVGKTGYAQSGKTQAQTITQAVTKAASDYIDPTKIVITSKSYAKYENIGQPEPFTDTNKNGKREASEDFIDLNGNGKFDLDQGKSGYGAAEEIVTYTATIDWQLYTFGFKQMIGKGGVVPLKSQIVVRNEPYQ